VRVVALHRIRGGCLVLDTPGMRELQLTAAGIAAHCRFADCQHDGEPGCAVRAAIDGDQLDPARLCRWRKLIAENRFSSASLAERRSKDRAFGKMVRKTMKDNKTRR
jgi:ribosome biogenesis GTPase